MIQRPDPFTLITAQPQPVFHQGLRQLIAADSRFQLLGAADNSRGLLRLAALHRPRLLLTDLHLPGGDGITVCQTIRRLYPDTGILVLCPGDGSDEVLQAIRAGASACLLRDRLPNELLPALEAVADGRLHHNALMQEALKQLKASADHHFSPRELEVINLICRQLSGHEIAEALSLSLRTIEEIRVRLQEKLGVRSGVGIALYAIKQGLVRVD